MRAMRVSMGVMVLLAACADGQSVVGGRSDGGADATDVVAKVDAAEVTDALDATDVADVLDATDVLDALDVVDATDVADSPDAVDAVDVVDAPVGCRSDGDCAGDPGGPACEASTGRCVACVTDAHCALGMLCAGDRCVAGCSAAHGCPSGQSCCTGACIDTQTALAHCGGCDLRCATPHATAACMNGRCAVASCEGSFVEGFVDCDGDAANGCEVDTATTVAHCGACGRACLARDHAAVSCAAGRCESRCDEGFADCDGDAGNGCEVDTRTTAAHCGACGRVCAPPNATGACAAGVCGVGPCATGFADCNRNVADGCEADTRTSVTNCGACGASCPAGANAIPACVGGSCRVSCAAGFADCDGDAGNGCEVDTRTSAAHCGGCGQACVAAGGAVSCAAGACTVTRCDAGRADCNGNGRDGCEVTLAGDAANCGACANACPAVDGRRVCSAGSCAPASCRAVRDANPAAVDGRYQLDLDGAMSGPARSYYCDMARGGWTFVANQVPAELLADTTATINEAQFGLMDHSWRLGNPEIARVRPAVAWRLDDAVTDVYVSPTCVVDWDQDYIRVTTQHVCTTGYTTPALTTLVNGRWTFCSARGIGINNLGANCSIRMNESGFGLGVGAQTNGRAYTCNYDTTRRVSLAFQ